MEHVWMKELTMEFNDNQKKECSIYYLDKIEKDVD